MKCAIFEEHSSSCVVYSRFSGTLFPVSMIDGDKIGRHVVQSVQYTITMFNHIRPFPFCAIYENSTNPRLEAASFCLQNVLFRI